VDSFCEHYDEPSDFYEILEISEWLFKDSAAMGKFRAEADGIS
jgi:hypothetical protein